MLSTKDPESPTFALDNLYLGNALLFHTSSLQNEKLENKEEFTPEELEEFAVLLEKGDQAYAHVIEFAPTTQDAHLNKAKINRVNGSDQAIEKAIESYENYIDVVTEKGEAELSKDRTQRELLAGYTFLGSQYSKSDKTKAIEYFNAALKLNPGEDVAKYINDSIGVLRNR